MPSLRNASLLGNRAFEGKGQSGPPNTDLESLKKENIFHRGLVVEVLGDASLREDPPDSLLASQVDAFYSAPRNSVICTLLTDGNSTAESSDIICFPFFSSHVCFPVKPGEQVWIVRQGLGTPSEERTYWMSRVPSEIALEDVNYTAFTRNITQTHTGSIKPQSRLLEVPNNESGEPIIRGEDGAVKEIATKSLESAQVCFEAVPRLTKRPGDLALQGSNNTAIILGTDRGEGTYNLSNRPSNPSTSNTSPKKSTKKKAGSIDIVAGRGRFFEAASEEIKKSRKKGPAAGTKNSTQPFITANDLDSFEVDKNPAVTQDLKDKPEEDPRTFAKIPEPGNLKTNPSEGDPDFLADASRIYVTEWTDVDVNLGLDQIIPSKIQGGKFEPVKGPSIAVKSDHIRIVARKIPNEKATKDKLPPKYEDVKGTIRIVKEGDSKKDLACIIIEADGTIQISGPKIFIGRSNDDGGTGDGPGPGKSQPYIKYKQLEDLWKATMDALDGFCTKLSTHTTPGYGSPSPQINAAASELQGKVATLKSDIIKVKSERIFGE